jgi:hypothetical protein
MQLQKPLSDAMARVLQKSIAPASHWPWFAVHHALQFMSFVKRVVQLSFM